MSKDLRTVRDFYSDSRKSVSLLISIMSKVFLSMKDVYYLQITKYAHSNEKAGKKYINQAFGNEKVTFKFEIKDSTKKVKIIAEKNVINLQSTLNKQT